MLTDQDLVSCYLVAGVGEGVMGLRTRSGLYRIGMGTLRKRGPENMCSQEAFSAADAVPGLMLL